MLGSPEIQFQTESGIGGSGGTMVEVPARLHRSIRALAPGEACLPGTGLVSTDVTVVADCEEMLVDGSTLDPIFIGAANLPGGSLGTSILDVPINIDIPGPEREDRGYCTLSGTAQVEQQSGIVHEVPCGSAFLSFARPTLTGTAPILGGQLIDNGDFTQVGTGHYSAMAGAPTLLEMVLNNNHPTEAFDGTLQLVTNNENYGAEMISGPILTQSQSLSYSLSSGPGDDFVVHFVPESEGTEEENAAVLEAARCFDLPEPQVSISPLSSRAVSIQAGESITVQMWSRSWPNCADGSCSGMAFDLEGAFSGGEPYEAKLSGSLIIRGSSVLQQAELSCRGQGVTALVTKCDDDPDGCEAVDDEVRDNHSQRPVGFVFDSQLHSPRPAITSVDTTISVTTTGRTVEELSTGTESGRIWETLTLPRGELTPGQEVTVTANFALTLVGETEGYEITEVVVGSKYQPASEVKDVDPTSFIGVARIEISSTPYMELTAQYQGAAWAVEVDEEEVVGLELTAYDLRTSDGGIIAEFTFLAPVWEIDRVQISHDLRAYGWDAFEDDCEDLFDNDNDGDVDCDDEDCDGHPACEGDDDDSAGDDDDDSAGDDDDDDAADDDDDSGTTDDGCSCSSASRGFPALLLALLLPALVLGRWRRASA